MTDKHTPFIFGIYPGGVAGTDSQTEQTVALASGPIDQPKAIEKALDQLQGQAPLLLIRVYLHYLGGQRLEVSSEVVNQIDQFTSSSRPIDLVLCHHATTYDCADWQQTISQVIEQYGSLLHCLQIAQEPNLYQFPGDGVLPQISQAIIDGVQWAKHEICQRDLTCLVGFNAIPSFNPTDSFWQALSAKVESGFLSALDYVGLDFFPDVFRPLPLDQLSSAVSGVLTHFRNVNLLEAGIGSQIPIHITEHGWATGPERSEQQQGVILETVIRQVYQLRDSLHITHYELFSLRDADSARADLFYQFGILKSDYSPKLAFFAYQRLIDELSADH